MTSLIECTRVHIFILFNQKGEIKIILVRDAVGFLTSEELQNFTNNIVDIACGLGEHITFLGLSAGGVLAAWAAQHRPDVDEVVLVAPSLTIGHLGVRESVMTMALFLTVPNILTQNIRPFKDGPDYTYMGHSTRALAEIMRLGASVFRSARKMKPAVQSILLVTNASDPAVNNSITWLLVNLWRAKGVKHLEEYAFGKEYHLIHDVIDPHQDHQQIGLVYPVLLELITHRDRMSSEAQISTLGAASEILKSGDKGSLEK